MTADEIQADIDGLRNDLTVAEATHVTPLRAQLDALYEQLYSQQAQCVHANVTQIDDGSSGVAIKYQCNNEDCKKILSIPAGGW